jgi:hypothetical protein
MKTNEPTLTDNSWGRALQEYIAIRYFLCQPKCPIP